MDPGGQSADQLVHVGDHIREIAQVLLVSVSGILPFLGVRRGNHGPVGEGHRVINEHGLLPVALHEVQNEVDRYVRPVFVFALGYELFVLIISRACVAGALVLCVPGMEKAMLVEARLGHFHPFAPSESGIGKVWRVVGLELPLPRDASLVAGVLHHVTESSFPRIENPEIGPVAVVVSTRHDLHPGRRAERLRVGMGKAKAFLGQLIDVRGMVGGSPVATEAINPYVVRHDEENVGLAPLRGKQREKEED